MRVLLVDDDYAVSQSIETMLKKEGMIVDTTDLGEDGLEIGKLYDYDIIILDLMLPDMNGYEVLKNLRSAKIDTPVLILSGLTEPDKKVKGLGYGADDYLTKPFDKSELLARIQAVVRRSKGHSNSIIRTGDVEVNLDTQTVSINNKPLHLTGKEYGIMELLSLRKGSTLNKDQFLNHLYGGIDEPQPHETRVLVPSPKVATYDMQPEMSAPEVCENVLKAIDNPEYGFILVNFANPDMVGHTGVLEAAEKACHVVDECVGKIADACIKNNIVMLLTADHGNSEVMVNPDTGKPQTAHTTNKVPFVLINAPKSLQLKDDGALCNIAPTVLELMGIPKPAEMDCDSLIK